MNALFLRRSDTGWAAGLGEKHGEELYVDRPEEPKEIEQFLSHIKTASVMMLWIRETPEVEIFKKFDIYPGDLRNKAELAEWLLYSASELSKLWEHPAAGFIDDLRKRVKYGVRPDVLELCRLPGVGRVRARAMMRRGFTTLEKVAGAEPKNLAAVEGIGRVLADTIHAAARKRRDRIAAGYEVEGGGRIGAEDEFEIPGLELDESGKKMRKAEKKGKIVDGGKKKAGGVSDEGEETAEEKEGGKEKKKKSPPPLEPQTTLFDY
jgi:predicted flap endonuclease-1-like 5' DNA nuclease